MSTEELRSLVQSILERPDQIDNGVLEKLSDEQLREMAKIMSPYCNTVGAQESFINISIVNMRERYMRRLMMTGLIGYLYRLVHEYKPDADISQHDKLFKKKLASIKGLTPEAKTELETAHAADIKRLTDTSRRIAKNFLDRNFNYNPDLHVRAAHQKATDTDQASRHELIRKRTALAASAPFIEGRVKASPEDVFDYLKGSLAATYEAADQSAKAVKSAIEVLIDPETDTRDKTTILMRRLKQLETMRDDVAKLSSPFKANETLEAVKIDPPVDVFHHFDRYVNNHWEELRDTVAALYYELPDIDTSVVYYDHFATEEEAKQHQVAHEDEFKLHVDTIKNNGTTLLGPFKENRRQLKFYNKNTEVLRLMNSQQEADHKLGQDLMGKVIRRKKEMNISEAGPDAPGLAAYAKNSNLVRELGAKQVLSPEEHEKLKKAVEEKEDAEVPEDAIQTRIFYPEEDADGNTVLKKQIMFTQAEAPLHMQEGSQYMDKYQPKREPGQALCDAYRTKVITDRQGQKVEICVAKKDE